MSGLHVVHLSLDGLLDKARQQETPPKDLDHRVAFSCPQGHWTMGVQGLESLTKKDSSGSKYVHFSAYLRREGPAAAQTGDTNNTPASPPSHIRASFALTAWSGAARQDLSACLGCEWPLHGPVINFSRHARGILSWSDLRRHAANGSTLQATITFYSSGSLLGPGDHLTILPDRRWEFAFAVLRGGQFSDATVRAGGREFATHRAVLAAFSPVFFSMLSSSMVEGRTAVVEVEETVPQAVELLLDHAYGGQVEVPLSLVLQLYALADRYQIRSDLVQQLRLWLSTVALQSGLLCQLLPAADTLCTDACNSSLFWQASAMADDIIALPELGAWQLSTLQSVVRRAAPLAGFRIAAAWVAAQQQPSSSHEPAVGIKRLRDADARACWPAELVGAISWGKASREDLKSIEAAADAVSGTQEIPGLYKHLFKACDSLYARDKGLR